MIAPMPTDWFPLWLSLRVAGLATLASAPLALALAWLLTHKRFRGRQILEGVILLPLMLPATVLAYYLLVLLAQGTPLGRLYQALCGAPLLFTWRAAALAAMLHTTPLLVRSCRDALEALDPSLERAARACGAPWWRVLLSVSLPQARRPLLAALVLAFGRALGDFGVTLMIAGNLPGQTQTMPVAIYSAAASGDASSARAFVLILSFVILGLLCLAARLEPKRALR